jgi:hypothetical protein
MDRQEFTSCENGNTTIDFIYIVLQPRAISVSLPYGNTFRTEVRAGQSRSAVQLHFSCLRDEA